MTADFFLYFSAEIFKKLTSKGHNSVGLQSALVRRTTVEINFCTSEVILLIFFCTSVLKFVKKWRFTAEIFTTILLLKFITLVTDIC